MQRKRISYSLVAVAILMLGSSALWAAESVPGKAELAPKGATLTPEGAGLAPESGGAAPESKLGILNKGAIDSVLREVPNPCPSTRPTNVSNAEFKLLLKPPEGNSLLYILGSRSNDFMTTLDELENRRFEPSLLLMLENYRYLKGVQFRFPLSGIPFVPTVDRYFPSDEEIDHYGIVVSFGCKRVRENLSRVLYVVNCEEGALRPTLSAIYHEDRNGESHSLSEIFPRFDLAGLLARWQTDHDPLPPAEGTPLWTDRSIEIQVCAVSKDGRYTWNNSGIVFFRHHPLSAPSDAVVFAPKEFNLAPWQRH